MRNVRSERERKLKERVGFRMEKIRFEECPIGKRRETDREHMEYGQEMRIDGKDKEE